MGIINCKIHGRTGITLVTPKIQSAVVEKIELPKLSIEKEEEFGLRFVSEYGITKAEEPVCSKCLEERIRETGNKHLIERWEESKSWGMNI